MSSIPLCAAFLVGALLFPIAAGADAPSSVSVGNAIEVPNSGGDTWELTWGSDGRVFTPSNDSSGFDTLPGTDIHFNEVFGDKPTALTGVTVNRMIEYGKAGTSTGPEKRTWKSSGCISLDGTLYWVIARHFYDKRQTAINSSIIKSNDGGKTWTRSEKENYDHPMFPGSRFATPYFISYGQDGHEAVADQSDKYVYALSDNGFWDNGDDMVLGRVLRSKIGDLDAKDWRFLKSGDGADESNWSSSVANARPVIEKRNHLGMGGPVYLAAQKSYLMIGWYYPAGGGRVTPDASKTTIWDFYVAPHPWGPWTVIGSHTFTPQGFYGPGVGLKFTSGDGNTVYAFTAGDFQHGSRLYKMMVVPLTLK
jgi:hypothetical protein